jgi:hypothetical protein
MIRALLLTILFFLNSATKAQLILTYTFSGSDYKIEVISNTSTLSSTLYKKPVESETYTEITRLQFDTTIKNFRLIVDSLLIEKADEVKTTINNINSLDSLFNVWHPTISQLHVDSLKQEKYQHFYYQMSLIKILKRHAQTNVCSCDEFNPYASNSSSFFCEEDIIINVDSLKIFANQYRDRLDSVQGGHEFKNFLDEYNPDPAPSLAKLRGDFNVLAQEENQITGACGSLQGNQCGCCGNYIGQCVLCHLYCFLHDYLCWKSNCQPVEVCHKGCVPSPCW